MKENNRQKEFRSFIQKLGSSLMGNLLAQKCKFIEIGKEIKEIYRNIYFLEKRDYSFADYVHIQTARKKGLKIVSFDKHLNRSKIFHWNKKIKGKKIKRLYLDASALIPLMKWEEQRSKKMYNLVLNDNTLFYLSNFTLSETYNVLNR